jgi:hypothetical protein
MSDAADQFLGLKSREAQLLACEYDTMRDRTANIIETFSQESTH